MPDVSLSKMKEKWFPKSLIGNVAGHWKFQLRRSQKGDGYVHVLHTAPQTRLNSSWIPSEDPHYRCPAQTCKDWPCIALHLLSQLLSNSHSSLTSPLYRQLSKCKHDSGEDVYDNLLVDAALYATAEDGVAAYQAGEEGVKRAFFPCGRRTLKTDHTEFVDYSKGG